VHDFSGEVQKFSGEVQNDLRGGAHLPTPPLKIRPWTYTLAQTVRSCFKLCMLLSNFLNEVRTSSTYIKVFVNKLFWTFISTLEGSYWKRFLWSLQFLLLHAIYGMQLSYSSKFLVVVFSVRTGGRKSSDRFVKYECTTNTEFFLRAFSCRVFIEETQRNTDYSPKIYIIERLRKINRGR
jgi:hypothetical protein